MTASLRKAPTGRARHLARFAPDSPLDRGIRTLSVRRRIDDAFETALFALRLLPVPPGRTTRFTRGTGSSNPASSSGESRANLTFGAHRGRRRGEEVPAIQSEPGARWRVASCPSPKARVASPQRGGIPTDRDGRGTFPWLQRRIKHVQYPGQTDGRGRRIRQNGHLFSFNAPWGRGLVLPSRCGMVTAEFLPVISGSRAVQLGGA
jgi:hypothetical protein